MAFTPHQILVDQYGLQCCLLRPRLVLDDCRYVLLLILCLYLFLPLHPIDGLYVLKSLDRGSYELITGTYGSVVIINRSLNSGSTVSPFSCADNSG